MSSTPMICLLERRGDGLGDDLRVGAGVGGAHHDRGRHDFRVFADRQLEQRDRARDQDEGRQDRREDRPVDEEAARISLQDLRVLLRRTMSLVTVLMCCSPIATSCGVTGMPGRTCCSPLTTIVSPALRPSRTTRRPSTTGPSFTGAVLDLVVRADREHELHALVGADGAVVDEQRVVLRRCR